MEGNDIEKAKRIGISQLVTCLPAIGSCRRQVQAGHLSLVTLRMLRALSPWPGVWTTINPTNPTNNQIRQIEKRLKILAAHVEHEKLILDTVQLEGKNPVQWNQFKKSYQ